MTDYASIPAMNWSSLKHLATSPLLFDWRRTHPEPDKPAYMLGRAGHCAILEPKEFKARYGTFDGKRDKRTAAFKEWMEENPGKECLKPAEHDLVMQCASRVMAHRVAAPMVVGGRFEVPIQWDDPETGIACKARLDYILPRSITDLKLTRAKTPRLFGIDASRLLYYGQLAFYHDGAITAGELPKDADRPGLVAAQNVEPFDVYAYMLTGTALEAGRQLYRSLLKKYQECVAAKWWPGIAPDLMDLDVEHWAPGMEGEPEEEEGW
jgi:hypothetical protein